MDEEASTKFKAWIREKAAGNSNCPICGTDEWIEPELVQWASGTMGVFGRAYPAIVITCKNCGYAQAFNAVVIGIAPAYRSPSEIQDASGKVS